MLYIHVLGHGLFLHHCIFGMNFSCEGSTMSDFEENLINCVQNYPHLWTVSSKQYKDLRRNDNSWNEIAETLGADAEKCKARWRSLRDTYRKQLTNAELQKSGAAGGLKRKWQWMEQLSFLRDEMGKRKTKSNVGQQADKPIDSAQCLSLTPSDPTTPDTYTIPKTPSDTPKLTKKRALEKQLGDALQTWTESRRVTLEKENDPDEDFARGIAAQLRLLPLRIKSRAKLHIQQVSQCR